MADTATLSGAESCQVTFQPLGNRTTVAAGTTLLEAGRRAGILLSASCGGVGVCGKCVVTVASGEMFPPASDEQAFLETTHHAPGTRLACEARVASSVVVQLPASYEQCLQLDGECILADCEALVESHEIEIEPPALDDSRSDYARIVDSLPTHIDSSVQMHPAAATQFAEFATGTPWRVTAYTRGSEVVGFAEPGCNALGLAVDIGCTKIAAFLLDLKTGTHLASAGLANPQITYGEDVISRLVYASQDPQKAATLASCVRESIAKLAEQLCEATHVDRTRIADVCLVGNTAMVHLLLQLPVSRLLHAPFVASVDRDINVPASELGWRFAPRAFVHVPPSIGGFVGADHVAMILARGIDRSNRVTVGLDIGTNTEICLFNPATEELLTTSVPSGPVFEGAHIHDGMRAASGAIDKVFSAAGEIRCHTLDWAAPVGICGSGILDLIAELRRLGTLDRRGHLLASDQRVRTGPCGLELLLVPAAQTGHGHAIVLTQHDVTQVQLAKAAIFAGIETLLHVAEINHEQVEEVAVAGAFGSYLDLRSALSIGLLPRFPNAEYLQIGNAAGAGAKMALISRSQRERARIVAREAARIELKHQTTFDRALVRATQFPPIS